MATKDKLVTAEGVKAVYGDLNGRKAELTKLYFDGAEIFRDEAHWEEYIPMTFDEIWDLCHDERNFVYIGDGQMKYYPQLDLNVSSKPESITFISTAQLDGKNNHTRIIINENNEVKTNQVIDTPWFDFVAEQKKVAKLQKDLAYANKRIENLEYGMPGYTSESDDDVLQTKVVPANAFPNASFDVIGGMSRRGRNLLDCEFASKTARGVTITRVSPTEFLVNGTSTGTGDVQISYTSLNNLAGKTLTLSTNLETSDVNTYVQVWDGHVRKAFPSVTFVLEEYEEPNVSLHFPASKIFNNVKFWVMLEEGSVAHDYEPYTPNLISAPVDGVVSVGKNLWDEEWEVGAISSTGVPISSQTQIRSKDFIKVYPSTTYYFVVGSGQLTGKFYDDQYNPIGSTWGVNATTSRAIETPSDARYFRFCMQPSYGTVYKHDIAIIKGSTGSYSPYSTTTTPIPSAILALPDYGIGVSDSVYNYVDYAEKKYHHRCVRTVFNDLSAFRLRNTNADGVKTYSIARDKQSPTEYVTNYNKAIVGSYAVGYINGVAQMYDRPDGEVAFFTDTSTFYVNVKDGLPMPIEIVQELLEEEVIDLSNILSDGDNIIPVEGGGTVTMHLPDENYAVDMPNTLTYDVKVGA